jgi:beta-aspartyl-peptidase (threonine type)
VMEKTSHVLLVGEAADKFAQGQGLEVVENSWFTIPQRVKQLDEVRAVDEHATFLDHDKKFGTVGAVALDSHGHLATAVSTGGLTNKMAGRLGGVPIIGAACYADNKTAAIAGTGTGEAFLKTSASHEICARMRLAKETLDQAAQNVIFTQIPSVVDGEGGVVAVDSEGNVTTPFNTGGMYRGVMEVGGVARAAIYEEDPL